MRKLLDEEAAWGVDQPEFYQELRPAHRTLAAASLWHCCELKADGRRIAVYGASAKGSTLLNYFQIGRDMVDFVVDRNTFKQGRYTPGTHLKIH